MLYAILKKMSNSELEHIRKPQYKINPLIISRWSPRSMTGEELRDEDLMSLFEAARWARLLLMHNLGDLFMQQEIQKSGIHFSTYWRTLTKSGLKMPPY